MHHFRIRRGDAGFTLVELLVVIAIIGILVSLLLPAVNSAREAARRTQCLNNIRQVGLALITYHDAQKSLPAAIVTGVEFTSSFDIWNEAKNGAHGTSWMLSILPFMEEGAVYDQWDFTTNVLGNALVAQTDIATFYCPSRRSGVRDVDQWLMFEQWQGGGTDYGACMGWGNAFWDDKSGRGRFPCLHNFSSFGQIAMGSPSGGPPNSCIPRVAQDNSLGLFSPFGAVPFRKLTDGTSKTFMVGEVERVGLMSGAMVAAGMRCIHSTHDGWAPGGVNNLFDTHFGGLNDGHFEHPGSDHQGGAHFVLADGSARFYSENLDNCILQQLSTFGGGELVESE